MTRRALFGLILVSLIPHTIEAQVTSERLFRAADEPQNWLTYSGTYSSQRFSPLRQVTPANVKDLEMKWVFQAQSLISFQATPLVVDGVMYLTQAPNDVVALDAKTGRLFWTYRYTASPGRLCCRGLVNRGLAILGDTLFMAAVDAHLIALDAKNGQPLWKTKVAEAKQAYGMTLAPLVIKDRVIVGVAGGESGIRGFIAAYDVRTGKEVWRFHTIPGPGEAGHDTWSKGGDAWKHGGAPVWLTGSYDPDLNLTYWGTGNPGPDFNALQRPGDNLFSESVVALDADTGKLKWYFQFTPNDPYDYDSTQIPVLVDATWNGSPRKLMLWANRNGFYYVLDRTTGAFLLGRPFTRVTWASGLDEHGRPILTPQPPDAANYPGTTGGTNWYSPSYSPRTGLFYVPIWEDVGARVAAPGKPIEYKEGQAFSGEFPERLVPMPVMGTGRGPINTWTEVAGHGAVIALDPSTGTRRWTFAMHDVTQSGILTTASDLLFTGGREGYFQALDARSGALLWKATVGGETAAGPITYEVDNKQYVAFAAGHSLFTFALR